MCVWRVMRIPMQAGYSDSALLLYLYYICKEEQEHGSRLCFIVLRVKGGLQERVTYGPSVHVKTWPNPQDRTIVSASRRDGELILIYFQQLLPLQVLQSLLQ